MQVSGSLFAPPPAAGPSNTAGPGVAVAKPSAEEAFLAFASKTPAEQMRERILSSLGLTEEDLKAMDPKQREQVEAKIKQTIKAQIDSDPHMRKGAFLDVKA